jgi:hypothetical protein
MTYEAAQMLFDAMAYTASSRGAGAGANWQRGSTAEEPFDAPLYVYRLDDQVGLCVAAR